MNPAIVKLNFACLFQNEPEEEPEKIENLYVPAAVIPAASPVKVTPVAASPEKVTSTPIPSAVVSPKLEQTAVAQVISSPQKDLPAAKSTPEKVAPVTSPVTSPSQKVNDVKTVLDTSASAETPVGIVSPAKVVQVETEQQPAGDEPETEVKMETEEQKPDVEGDVNAESEETDAKPTEECKLFVVNCFLNFFFFFKVSLLLSIIVRQ
jgi:hypothetical protein